MCECLSHSTENYNNKFSHTLTHDCTDAEAEIIIISLKFLSLNSVFCCRRTLCVPCVPLLLLVRLVSASLLYFPFFTHFYVSLCSLLSTSTAIKKQIEIISRIRLYLVPSCVREWFLQRIDSSFML